MSSVIPLTPVAKTPMTSNSTGRRISLGDIGSEPFRAFFPAGLLAGLVGVSLWPLHHSGLLALYPGEAHARIMTFGLFGGFIIGFLGTAMPRMLSAAPIGTLNVFLLLGLHLTMLAAYSASQVFLGDALFLALLTAFLGMLIRRVRQRQSNPPPGFILVALSLLCGWTGAAMGVGIHLLDAESGAAWVPLQRLLSYQGWVLLPILGIGPFFLPRLLGRLSAHEGVAVMNDAKVWRRKAALAMGTGLLILASFAIEAAGWMQFAYGLRFALVAGYLALEFPFKRGAGANKTFWLAVVVSLVMLVAGYLAAAFAPGYRVGLLHLTLVGGFGTITFVVATRVVFGHSGQLALLRGRNAWLITAVGLMLFGMLTRISGDFWPRILVSHQVYGALLWAAGAIVWGVKVLPKVLVAEEE